MTRQPLLATSITTLALLAACSRCSSRDGGDSAGNQQPPEVSGIGDRLRAPAGFRIEVFATGVENARAMALGREGTLFVGSRSAGKVYALVDSDRDHRADRTFVVDEGLRQPAGVAFRDGSLYVSAVDRVLRYDRIEDRLEDPPEPVVVSDAFPSDAHHGWKFIRFGPDGLLYVPVGAPCNVCEREDRRYASIMRMKPDGSGLEIFAHGVRNTVGFDWHPGTGQLWFTDNGRDHLGDDQPPDELNRARTAGQHFGFPYCHGGDIPDPELGQGRSCDAYVPPVQELGPHVAALGMRFYDREDFGERYRGAVFIAEHGSWNRTTPIGYRVTVVRLDGAGRAVGYEPFVEGWLDPSSGTAWGRPADVLVHPDGSLYISDDRAGWILRVARST